MAQTHEWMFYEIMWRNETRGRLMPQPWWVQQYFRRWTDAHDSGLFSSKEAAFASNASYRYWNMVGVKDHHQESLVGQAGEVEPVYDAYSLSFFLYDPLTRALHHPQVAAPGTALGQSLQSNYLPIVITRYEALGVRVEQRVLATTIGPRQRSIVLVRFSAQRLDAAARNVWLCVSVSPVGVTGFERHDKAGRTSDRRISFLRYLAAEQRIEVGPSWGPLFDTAPGHFGLYGNPAATIDPDHYLASNAFADLRALGALNGVVSTTDHVAGYATGVFAWPLLLDAANPVRAIDMRLPVDDYRGNADLAELRSVSADALEAANATYWTNKLDGSGLQLAMPPAVAHLFDLFRTSRAHLLILADDGAIHPGPTIYDSFWIRDSSVEAIACALAGDVELAERQLGTHHRSAFNQSHDRIGPVSAYGFFGGEHEKNDREWDSNGQALWAIGRFDRIRGPAQAFGAGMFSPYVLDGARWIANNRASDGLLHSGWSAEHIGDKNEPHYWDDLWALAGLYEAARLAERTAAPQVAELWAIFDDVKRAVMASMRWVLTEQARAGQWQTFIPTGPADVNRLDSTLIGAIAYFHPCRLHIGPKLDPDIDYAHRQTLETIWSRFIDGGFRHDSAWNAYGPYLTLQLAHCFLLLGQVDRMDQCLAWAVGNAAYAHVTRNVAGSPPWQVALGAWNEQHAYPIAKDFAEFPNRAWYMGDIPHGWACAELMLLLRDILFFEADEDGDRHIYLAPGVMPHWVRDGETIALQSAPTVFGAPFGFSLTHRASTRRVEIAVTTPAPAGVRLVYVCRFGNSVRAATADGVAAVVTGREVRLPAGTRVASVDYR